MSNIWDKIYSDDSAFFGEDPSDFAQKCYSYFKFLEHIMKLKPLLYNRIAVFLPIPRPLPVTNAILNNEFKIGVLLCYKFLLKPPVRTSNSKFAHNLNDITKNLQFI